MSIYDEFAVTPRQAVDLLMRTPPTVMLASPREQCLAINGRMLYDGQEVIVAEQLGRLFNSPQARLPA